MSETEPKPEPAPPPSGLSALGLTRRVSWIVAALVLVPAVLFVGGKYYGWFGPPAQVARPAVGGPFALVDTQGRAVTESDFRGRFMLVYFGFTYCPDVCPTSLTAIAQALDRLGADADKVVPVFITVDPERDTPEQMKEYVRHFHPRLVGLTGTPEQIAAAAKAYRVYYAKAKASGAPADDYTMDHTSIIYLMGRDGKFLAHFSHGTEPEAIAARVRAFF
jgi:protein SCO1/2